ncbi:hypothetical protein NI389_05455 [Pseudoalteromonas xiamenensis]|uniref:hypothetical protein n=1 Tax=Pseudoalteromonas xiamenensis TaxID=882626 RepID=UPI0027E466AB|nr:hypothetical protein [Pseudoalteromonas xiamenensis]WMN61534.1 hypothetical protein NI389_05455 [Pseudoalteromonas xiamenensis]
MKNCESESQSVIDAFLFVDLSLDIAGVKHYVLCGDNQEDDLIEGLHDDNICG